MYTTSMAFLEALQEAGVSYIFANLGSDHPGIIESYAQARKENKSLPEIIICPHEMVALSAAHGYAQATGKAQALIMHVDVGTQNMGGAIHNAAKGRVPVLIFAGASPHTQEGELTGSRNEHIHWLQDAFDQRGIVRDYMKYNNEIRTGKNIKQMVHRAMQIASSDPKGPVYLMATREVMEEETTKNKNMNLDKWQPIQPMAVQPMEIENLVEDLVKSSNPLIVTSYLGRNPQAVNELINLSEHLSIPVIESVPNYMNFPSNHEMHSGYLWNDSGQSRELAEADFILVLDSDVPWIPTKNKPADDATIYYIDIDPLKENMPLWYIPSNQFFKADSYVTLKQINSVLHDSSLNIPNKKISDRWDKISRVHKEQKEKNRALEQSPSEVITAAFLTACIRDVIDDQTIVLNEGISNYGPISRHIGKSKSGTLFGSGASSLGWNGGAAIGIKLATPDKTVVNLTGDGSYLLSVPSTVHWMANQYQTPFLTIIYNNHGWKSPKLSTLSVHPEGYAQKNNQFGIEFDSTGNLAKVAEAVGEANAYTVNKPENLKETLQDAYNKVKNGVSVVVDVQIKKIANEE